MITIIEEQNGDFLLKGGFCSAIENVRDSITDELISNEPVVKVYRKEIDRWATRLIIPEKNKEIMEEKLSGKSTDMVNIGDVMIDLEFSSGNLYSNIEDIFDRLGSVEISESEGCLILNEMDLCEYHPYWWEDTICEQDIVEDIVIFGDVKISKELINSDGFDFRDFLRDYDDQAPLPCDCCTSLSRRLSETKPGSTHRICKECVGKISIKCARIGDNQKVAHDVISTLI